ncbi:MAG: hypothetical protein K6G68_05355, partial [Oscillospiraceae bacterium]|nr:hypothetical protein [Oscillospiraceae bacterium]
FLSEPVKGKPPFGGGGLQLPRVPNLRTAKIHISGCDFYPHLCQEPQKSVQFTAIRVFNLNGRGVQLKRNNHFRKIWLQNIGKMNVLGLKRHIFQ